MSQKPQPNETLGHKIKKNITNKLIAGLVVIIPLLGTLFIFNWVFRLWDQFLNRPIVHEYHEYYIPGMGIVLSLIVIYGVGVFVTNFIGGRIFRAFEKVIEKTPFLRGIYNAIKQIVTTFTQTGKDTFKKVVVVEFPSKGVRMLGFLTATSKTADGKDICTVFLPTSPNPTNGFLAFFPKEEVSDINMSVEEGMKMIVSGGIIMSDKFVGGFSS